VLLVVAVGVGVCTVQLVEYRTLYRMLLVACVFISLMIVTVSSQLRHKLMGPVS